MVNKTTSHSVQDIRMDGLIYKQQLWFVYSNNPWSIERDKAVDRYMRSWHTKEAMELWQGYSEEAVPQRCYNDLYSPLVDTDHLDQYHPLNHQPYSPQ